MASQAVPQAYFLKIRSPIPQKQPLSGAEKGGEEHNGHADGPVPAEIKLMIEKQIAMRTRSFILQQV